MMAPKPIPGSFRDPSGRIFQQGTRIFRTISSLADKDFSIVESSNFMSELVEEGLLVDWRDVTTEMPELAGMPGVSRVLEHPRLDMISYPYEWSFGALKAAALAHIEIQIRALEHNIVLSDATAFNIQFCGAQPIFIDHLSFRPYREGEFWDAHRQFCEHFLNPLLIRTRRGVPHNAWLRGNPEGIPGKALASLLPWLDRFNLRILINIYLPVWFEGGKKSNTQVAKSKGTRQMPVLGYRGMLESLQKLISSLSVPDVSTVWSDYAENTSYSSGETDKKRSIISDFCTEYQPEIIWDVGCNTGEYSKVALESGAKLSIGFEFDVGALERAYARACGEKLHFTPLYMDAANPTPSQGWNQCERVGLSERRNADGLLALAVIHHLCIGRNIPLAEAVGWLVGLAPVGIIEFVPKNDPMVVELLSLRDDIFDDYSIESFNKELSQLATVVRDEAITENGRRLIWYKRIE